MAPGLDIYYAQVVRSNGSLSEPRLLPPRFRPRRGQSSAVTIDHPDHARFPNFAKAARWECPLRPKTCVFIPFLWWHELRVPRGVEHVAYNIFFPPSHSSAQEEMESEVEALEESMHYLHRMRHVVERTRRGAARTKSEL